MINTSLQIYTGNNITKITEACLDSNSKKFYRFGKFQQKESLCVGTLEVDGKMGTINKEKANVLKQQFKLSLPKTTERVPEILAINIAVDRVKKLVEGVNPLKVAGPDAMTARILKMCVLLS